MLKLALSVTAAGALGLGLTTLSTAAHGQSTSRGEVIVYGNDPCPRATDDTVVVCVRRKEEERFRIPQVYRETGTRQQNQSWAAQSREMRTMGSTGTGSCSAVGPGGHTGCVLQKNERWAQEREEAEAEATAPIR